MLLLALPAAVALGLIVGLIGGGGSVLSVPVFRYALGMGAGEAITTSLLVVGITSAAALVPHARAGRVRWGTGLLFGPAGMAGAYTGGVVAGYLSDTAQMTVFGVMMAGAAWAMLRRRPCAPPDDAAPGLARVIAIGGTVGLLTGIAGAGGGFLIVPALVLLIGLPMHAAVGTSLLVITMNCGAGLAGRIGHVDLDLQLTLIVAAAAAVGSVAGARLSGRIPQAALRRVFGWVVVAMAAFVLIEQLV